MRGKIFLEKPQEDFLISSTEFHRAATTEPLLRAEAYERSALCLYMTKMNAWNQLDVSIILSRLTSRGAPITLSWYMSAVSKLTADKMR